MSKGKRDYKAEEVRRNLKAQELGYTSRAQQRYHKENPTASFRKVLVAERTKTPVVTAEAQAPVPTKSSYERATERAQANQFDTVYQQSKFWKGVYEYLPEARIDKELKETLLQAHIQIATTGHLTTWMFEDLYEVISVEDGFWDLIRSIYG